MNRRFQITDCFFIFSFINLINCSVQIKIFECEDVFVVVRIRNDAFEISFTFKRLLFVFSLDNVFFLFQLCNILKFFLMLLIIHNSLLLNLNSPHIRYNLGMSSCSCRVLLPLNRFLVNQLIQLHHFSRKNLPLLIRPLKIHPLRPKLLTLPYHIKNRRQAVSVRLRNSVVRIDL